MKTFQDIEAMVLEMPGTVKDYPFGEDVAVYFVEQRSEDRKIERSKEEQMLDVRPQMLEKEPSGIKEKGGASGEVLSEGEGVKRASGANKKKQSGEFDWEKVLAATKKTNPALHSVLGRAEIRLEDNTLHLAFQYALHRKKLEQTQYRTQLARIIQDVCDMDLAIVIEGDEQLAAGNDDATKKVADLMGGGERVTV